jgi:hypothetical protein
VFRVEFVVVTKGAVAIPGAPVELVKADPFIAACAPDDHIKLRIITIMTARETLTECEKGAGKFDVKRFSAITLYGC